MAIHSACAGSDEYDHQELSPFFVGKVVPKENQKLPEHVGLLQILEGADVPREAIHVLDRYVNTTLDEAMCICDYIRSQGDISSILLVTSKYHSGRAKRIFEEAFRQAELPVTVVSAPTSLDSFSQEEWYKSYQDIKHVFFEWIKDINFEWFTSRRLQSTK